MSEPSYGKEFAVQWLTCTVCGMTDREVEVSTSTKLPAHVDVKICMNKVQGLPLHEATPNDVAHYTGREPNYYPLDAAEESAIAQAVEDWRRTHLEDQSPEHDGDAS